MVDHTITDAQIEESLRLPTYGSISTIPPEYREIGTTVYVDGSGNSPQGIYYHNGNGFKRLVADVDTTELSYVLAEQIRADEVDVDGWLDVPTYSTLDDIDSDDESVGGLVYVDGTQSEPAGMYEYTPDGWRRLLYADEATVGDSIDVTSVTAETLDVNEWMTIPKYTTPGNAPESVRKEGSIIYATDADSGFYVYDGTAFKQLWTSSDTTTLPTDSGTATFPMTDLSSDGYARSRVTVPDGSTLKVVRAGLMTDSGDIPSGVELQFRDVDGGSVFYTQTDPHDDGEPLSSSDGPKVVEFRLYNGTDSEVTVGGHATYTLE